MATLETYRDRFAESGWQVFERAIEEARLRGQNLVGVEHILYALAQGHAEYFSSLLRSLSENPDALAMLLELIEARVAASPEYQGQGIRLASEAIELCKLTLKTVRSNGRRRIEATDLFITLVMEEKTLLRQLLKQLLEDPRAERKHWRDLFAVVESVGAARVSRAKRDFKYQAGETVRIKSGAFAAFTGIVELVDEANATLSVRVSIFGREQPVMLGVTDVEKLKSAE